MFLAIFPIHSTRDDGAIVGQGGSRLEKGTCTYYDVIMTSELNLQVVVVLGTGDPRPKSPTGPLCENYLLTKYSSSVSPTKTMHAGTSREPFCLGAVKLNLLESTWS